MSTLTKEQIAALLTKQRLSEIAPSISGPLKNALLADAPKSFSEAKINTVVRIAHFFAQILKETGGLRRLDENLKYTTAARIKAIWPSRFATVAAAQPYVSNPEKLANYVYANKNGNGDVASGDGWRYRGSGLIQLTGKGNFKSVGQLIGVGMNLVSNPDSVRKPDAAVVIAVGYWTARGINSVADGKTAAAVNKVTALVNPYENAAGKTERRNNFDHVLAILQAAAAAPEAKGLEAADQPDEYQLSDFDLGDALGPAVEESTEPSAADVLADRAADFGTLESAPTISAIPPVYWPNDDKNAPDYYHLARLPTDPAETGNFRLNADDLELLLEANAFELPNGMKTVTLAFRGASLGAVNEQIGKTAIDCIDVRPDHSTFRCALGFWYRNTGKITLFSGSTVPAPKYMKNYYFKKNGLPHTAIDCNMLPTGHYTFRVAEHAAGTIKPALRMSEPDDPGTDARVCVWRTSNDLTYGLSDVLDPPRHVYDNVHCTYFLNYNSAYEASFSSAGCLTVRGRKDPSDQWEKFQTELNKIGNGKRTNMILLTGKEAALASQGRAAGVDRAALLASLRRLRIGSSGDAVKKLQGRLGVGTTGFFGAVTQQALVAWQKGNSQKPDAIYSPGIDQATGWGIF